jgi:hypothetical protein
VHFEFRQNDLAVNPHTLLPKSKDPDTVATAQGTWDPNHSAYTLRSSGR